MSHPVLLLVDGNNLVHRAYHALPPLSAPKTGEMVNAVFGFASSLLKVLSDIKPNYCGVAFDKGRSFRRDNFAAYKAQRKKADEELTSQWPRVRQLVDAFGLPVFELEGYEADDLLGTLARRAEEQGIDTVIFTGDKDALQLVSDHVKVLTPGRTLKDTMLFDAHKVMEKLGVGPEHVTDLKGLMGDASDNIPGVPGVGEKTAAKLVQQFGSVEEIYRRLEEVSPARLKQLLTEHRAEAEQSKALTTIVKDVPIELKLHACGEQGFERLVALFRELDFTSLVSRIPQRSGQLAMAVEVREAALPEVKGCTVTDIADLDRMTERISQAKELAIEIEFAGPGPMEAELVGIALSPGGGEAYYLPVGHHVLDAQLPVGQVLSALKRPLEDSGLQKIGHNIKCASLVLARHGVSLKNLAFDTQVAAHLVGEKALGLKALVFQRLGQEITTAAELGGKGAKQISLANVAMDQTAQCACIDADVIFRLKETLAPVLESEGLWKLFAEVEMPLVPVLAQMEWNGVALDTSLLQEMSRNMEVDLRRCETEAYRNVGHEFNLNSSQQLGRILFEELRLPAPRRAHGAYSTEASVLEELRGVHPVIDNILEYRQLSKLKSTYLDSLPGLVNPLTGRLHTSFNQTGTTTGRLSSSDPNLQNIPVRGQLGRKIRHAFTAPEGSLLVAGDYSQIDLRVLAHLSGDTVLKGSFQRDEDIHAATAALVFGVPIDQVTPDMRRLAKTVNFGVVYGMSEYGLEQATDLTREQARQFIRAYFEKYPGVQRYMDSTKRQAHEKGYVQTLLGRKRHVPEVKSPNRQIREAGERMAANTPVQGTSADIIKVAMIRLHQRMQQSGLKTKLTLQVHDELILEVPQDEFEEIKPLLCEIMPNAVKLDVPVKVDVKSGRNWGEME